MSFRCGWAVLAEALRVAPAPENFGHHSAHSFRHAVSAALAVPQPLLQGTELATIWKSHLFSKVPRRAGREYDWLQRVRHRHQYPWEWARRLLDGKAYRAGRFQLLRRQSLDATAEPLCEVPLVQPEDDLFFEPSHLILAYTRQPLEFKDHLEARRSPAEM